MRVVAQMLCLGVLIGYLSGKATCAMLGYVHNDAMVETSIMARRRPVPGLLHGLLHGLLLPQPHPVARRLDPYYGLHTTSFSGLHVVCDLLGRRACDGLLSRPGRGPNGTHGQREPIFDLL
jgi:hypothetical protein